MGDKKNGLVLRQGGQIARNIRSLLRLGRAVLEEGIQGGKVIRRTQPEQARGFAATAPLAGQHLVEDNAGGLKGLADGPRLGPAALVKIALGAAIVQLEVLRIARAGRQGMAHDGVDAWLFQELKTGCLIGPGGRCDQYQAKKREKRKQSAG